MIKLKPFIREQTLVEKLRTRASIRRQIPTRKSVQNNEPDRLADLLEQAADEIEHLEKCIGDMDDIITRLESRLNNSENFNQHD